MATGAAVGGASVLALLAVLALRLRRPALRGLRRLRARVRAPAWWRRRVALRRRAAHAQVLERDRGALSAVATALGALPAAAPRPYAVQVDERSVTLLMAPAGPEPPPPWRTDDGGHTWRAPRPAPGEAATSAVLPLLATVGVRGEARVLVDLGRASGVISVEGDQRAAGEIVAALTGELAVAPWSANTRATLVAGAVTEALATAEAGPGRNDEIDFARVLVGRRPEDAPNELLGIASPVPEAATGRLAHSRRLDTRLAVVAAGPVSGARWRWTIGADGGLDLGPLGLAVDTHIGELTAATFLPAPRRRRV
jgi:hypothetical protein